jgi:glycosyltransferase involved in cell wall biosynthesis
MRHVNIASGHLDRLRPRRVAGSEAPAKPLTFATLGAMTSRQKGSDTLVAALRRLREWGLDDRYRMLIGGWVPPELEPELRSHPGVVIRGLYDSEHIDEVLRGVDVGVIPSVWEEVSPITGREFLALGIPLVANALGGLVDYTREGETGWLNHASDADGLAAIMRDLIAAPDRVVATSRRIAERRDELVISMDAHVREVDAVYAEVAGD